ncbi:hypothetical protein [Mucilaginibacter sp.]
MYLIKEAIAWVKSGPESHEVVQIVPETIREGNVLCYKLYTAYEPNPDYLGRILFDAQGYWIYDGETLSVIEQEQVAKFIINYVEII